MCWLHFDFILGEILFIIKTDNDINTTLDLQPTMENTTDGYADCSSSANTYRLSIKVTLTKYIWLQKDIAERILS